MLMPAACSKYADFCRISRSLNVFTLSETLAASSDLARRICCRSMTIPFALTSFTEKHRCDRLYYLVTPYFPSPQFRILTHWRHDDAIAQGDAVNGQRPADVLE